jgi:uncharacterized protein (TIGR02145 family)
MLNQNIQNYKILSPLGQVGMAKVYLAVHNLLGNKIAIKILNKEYVHNDNIRKRFLAEAKSMFRMSHPNIIKVTDLIDDGDTVAFVMEYIQGETLKEFIERKGKLSDEEIKSIFSQMLEAVGYVHKQKLVHRDIKPSNFMIDTKSKVKLMDFGIAKNTHANSAEYTQTVTGMQMGTPMYMSPEQIKSTKEVTFASDIYSLGVVLWQMVTGKKPYDMNTLSSFELQLKIVQEALPKTYTQWDAIIAKSTAKNVKDRYRTCDFILNFKASQKISEANLEEKTIFKNFIFRKKQESTKYPSVKIGNQVWMSKNLDVDCFRNGDIIHEAKTFEQWRIAGKKKQPAWCYYDNDSVNRGKYGKLYNWYAVNDPRGLAPDGWHVPSDNEWSILIDFLGGNDIAGKKMKSRSGWSKISFFKSGNGTNKSGFTGFPGGYRYNFGDYNYVGKIGNWWSSTESNADGAWLRSLSGNYGDTYRSYYNKGNGFSVRCLRD